MDTPVDNRAHTQLMLEAAIWPHIEAGIRSYNRDRDKYDSMPDGIKLVALVIAERIAPIVMSIAEPTIRELCQRIKELEATSEEQ